VDESAYPGRSEIETKTVALPRLNDPLGRSEEVVSRRLRAMAADALAGKDDDAAEAEAVTRLIGLRCA
jgi:hypothetical protein